MHLDPDASLAAPIRGAMRTLAQRQVLREVLDELAARDTPVLVLKGHALAQWLYPLTEQRETADVDLLLPGRADVDGLMAWLEARGFHRIEADFAGDMVCFELACRGPKRAGHEVELDLHWRLSTLPLFAFRFDFAELLAGSQPLPRLHPHARGLGPVHALAHACMHRAQNVPGGTQDEHKWLRDIELLAGCLGPAAWSELADLAARRGLAAVILDGLEAAGRHALRHAPPALSEGMRNAATKQGMDMSLLRSWAYVQWQCWRAIPGWKEKLRWLRQRLWPTPQYLRHRHGAAARTSWGLRRARILSAMRKATERGRQPE